MAMLKASSVQCHAPAQLLNRELGERNREPSIQRLIKVLHQTVHTHRSLSTTSFHLFTLQHLCHNHTQGGKRLHFNLMNLINLYICNPALNRCSVLFWQCSTS